ncbi:MAG: hypothetical protein J6D52_03910 [Clostridia bacterium]|nr:hypothetical protein [Clostridia bacterium]
MSETILVALLSLLGTRIGTFGGIVTGSKLMTYRIEQLEKKVEKHNSVVERTYKLEGEVVELQHDIRDIKNKIN